ncbi:MAG: PIN domain-containing protein [Candidatus Electrothrix communis]|nr:MAG: PIN domain-containing protein [Candidatus Electrothrix communis]
MSCPPATKRQDPCPQVEDFVSRLEVLEYGRKAAAHYGDIRADLERKGTVIGVNDLHIAGHARSEGMTLVSNNLREFERVEGLRVVNWMET